MHQLQRPPHPHRLPPRPRRNSARRAHCCAPRQQRRQQRGVAIITVLVIAVLIVTLAAVIFARQSRAVRQNDNVQALERAWQYTYTLEQYAALQLQIDAKTNKYDTLTDRWATETQQQTVPQANGVTVRFKGKLEDMQARFNLNNLLSQDAEQKGKLDVAALSLLKPFVTNAGLPSGFVDVIADWLDANTLPQSADGAERDFYLSGNMPYLAADMPFVDISEVRLLRLDNIEPQQKDKALKNFLQTVTVLPFKKTTINPNTASKAVLSALGLTNDQLNLIKEKRTNKQAYKTKEAFFQEMGFDPEKDAKQKTLTETFDVTSQYFRLTGEIQIGHARVFLNSLLFREPNGKVRVIMHQFDRASDSSDAQTTKQTTTTTDTDTTNDASNTSANTN